MYACGHVACCSSPATLIQIFLLLATVGPQASGELCYLSPTSHFRNTGVIDTDYCVQFHMGSGDSNSGLPTCSAISPAPGMLFPKGLTTFTCSRRRCPFSCALYTQLVIFGQTFNCADTSCPGCLPCRPQAFVMWNYSPSVQISAKSCVCHCGLICCFF